MEFHDDAFVHSARSHGETGALVDLHLKLEIRARELVGGDPALAELVEHVNL